MGKLKIKLTKRQVITGVGIVVLLVAALGAGFLVRWLSEQNSGQGDNSGQLSTDDQRLTGTLQEVQELRAQGNTGEANKKIDEALANASTPNQEKYDLYLQKGSEFMDAGKPAEAAAAFEQARAISETYEVMNIMGEAYRAAGDKDKAIAAFKRAIELIPQSNPMRDAEKSYLEQAIRDLGGQP